MSDKIKLWVRWTTASAAAVRKVRERFAMPTYTTLNGLTPCEIEPNDLPLLEETARRGFLCIVHADWCKKGAVFVCINRKN